MAAGVGNIININYKFRNRGMGEMVCLRKLSSMEVFLAGINKFEKIKGKFD